MNDEQVEVDAVEAGQEAVAPDAVTAVVVVMTLDGNVQLAEAPLNLLRQPSNTDLKMLAWFINDQVNNQPPAPPAPKSEADIIREKLAQRKE